MTRTYGLTIVCITVLLVGTYVLFFKTSSQSGSATHSTVVQEIGSQNDASDTTDQKESEDQSVVDVQSTDSQTKNTQNNTAYITTREVLQSESISLPLSGSAPTTNVRHSIPIEEIHRGCFMQDCIPSVDDPEFVSVDEANEILPDDTIGIALEYKDEVRFYPFNMLVTREIVNDVVAGDPLLVTYCPLCGTGVVFDRTVDGTVHEFGVSGMLWQSNLLMYNRAVDLENRNLWSQVLGEAVVGNKTGQKLTIVPSNIVRYGDWRDEHNNALVLNTGNVGDPYGGDYFGVAMNFDPNFDPSESALSPTVYVFGIEVDGSFKAYPRDQLPAGVTIDSVAETVVTITKSSDNEVTITDNAGTPIPVVTGFWFSWISAHPESGLWKIQ